MTKLYRLLLRLYPARFREEYEAPMERQFRDEYREAEGSAARVTFLFRALWDILTSAPAELARELRMDLGYAMRVYRTRASSALLAVLALSLAIGASTAVFSVLNALLLRSLPFRDAGRIVEIRNGPVTAMQGRAAFDEWRRKAYLEDAAAFTTSEMDLTSPQGALRLRVTETTANFFGLLGTTLLGGRAFAPEEDLPGGAHTAIISHSLWQREFGGSPSILGATVRINQTPVVIAGIAPPLFDYPSKTSVWVSSVYDFLVIPKQSAFWFQTIGRMRPDVSFAQARQMIAAEKVQKGGDAPTVTPLREELAGPASKAVWVLCGIVSFLLLAACANVAQLLLSRTVERRQELALREALGASRGRIVQQLTTEAAVLTLAAFVPGLAIAYWGATAIATIAPPSIATQDYTRIDWRVLGFALLLTAVTGWIFGVIPAWIASGRSQYQPGSTTRLRTVLLAIQAALTLTLLASSITMGRSFLAMLDTDLGFRTGQVASLRVSLQGAKYKSGEARWRYYSEALDRLRALPGVEAAGGVRYLPLVKDMLQAGGFRLDSGVKIEGVLTNAATPGYFRVMRIRLLAGDDSLRISSNRPVVVNAAFATKAGLEGGSIVGRQLTASWSKEPYTIAGVVDSARFAGPAYPSLPQLFWPMEEEPGASLTFVARASGMEDGTRLLARCRDAIRDLDAGVPIYDVKTLDDRLRETVAQPRFYATAVSFFGVLALILAILGVHGAAAYAVEQRKREMAIRIALGSTGAAVRNLLLRDGVFPVAFGAAAGILGALAAGQYLSHLIEGASEVSIAPVTCAISAAGLLLIAALAVWLAVTGIARLDPALALRSE